jgi:hypothetical protein
MPEGELRTALITLGRAIVSRPGRATVSRPGRATVSQGKHS